MTQLLREYLAAYELAPVFTEEEILHYLRPVEGVIETHVVEGKGKIQPLDASRPEFECGLSASCHPKQCSSQLSIQSESQPYVGV